MNPDEIQARLDEMVQARWIKRLDKRQQRLIENARVYARNDPPGGPGHNLMLIIARMADMLDEHELPSKD